jgi:hypothetical protein
VIQRKLHSSCLYLGNCSNTPLFKNYTDLKASHLVNYFLLIIFHLNLARPSPSIERPVLAQTQSNISQIPFVRCPLASFSSRWRRRAAIRPFPSTAAPPFSGSGSRKNREAVMWVRHRGSVTRCGEPPHAGSVMLAHAHVRSDAVSASSSALRTLSNRRGIKTCLHPGCRRPARRRSPRRPLRSARSYQTPKPAPSSAVCTVLSNI